MSKENTRKIMNQKELGEIRRRIRPEHNAIHHIYGCYVNTNKEIISSIDEPLGLLSKEEVEKYFGLLKKTLSGALGKNLLDISFATRQVMDSEEHRLLSALRKSELADAGLREAFYQCIIDHIDMEDQNYLILMAYDVYDVPHYGKDEIHALLCVPGEAGQAGTRLCFGRETLPQLYHQPDRCCTGAGLPVSDL